MGSSRWRGLTAPFTPRGLAGCARPGFFLLSVLATGIVPQTEGLADAFRRDRFGFLAGASNRTGFYSAGCVHRPEEVSGTVQDATGAALRALQCAVRSARHG
jgi:heterodisulfide reductase subunit A-like polyferredoxin